MISLLRGAASTQFYFSLRKTRVYKDRQNLQGRIVIETIQKYKVRIGSIIFRSEMGDLFLLA